jgi:hypothetical protein
VASLQTVRRLLRSYANKLGRTRPTLYLILLLAFQLIYETVVATLALTYMVPSTRLNCGLEEKWKQLYQNKDEGAIRRIQDRYDCCGFNSVKHMPWPFQGEDVPAGTCQARFDRTQSCAGPWRQAEQINAGSFLLVTAFIFAMKV